MNQVKGENRGREAARGYGSGNNGACHKLSPPSAVSPTPLSPWTCTSEIECRSKETC